VCICQVLEAEMRPDTVLVSIMTVNNEIGVRQPVEEIGTCYCRMTWTIMTYSVSDVACFCSRGPV